jgi:hypothetical protein
LAGFRQYQFTYFKLSQRFIANADFALGYLHRVDVSSVPDVSDVHAASIFRIKVSRLGEYSRTHLDSEDGAACTTETWQNSPYPHDAKIQEQNKHQ